MVISEQLRERIEAEIAKFPEKRGALLPALHLIQDEHGYVSLEVAVELAELLEILPVQVLEVVSFYNMFHSSPQGRHEVCVCTNLPCSLRGSRTLLRQLEAHLGVREGETTADGRVTLRREECLGACAYAPMMRVNDRYCEDLDTENAKAVLDSLE
jgi:NADH-quinone oxidoreductase subunit E